MSKINAIRFINLSYNYNGIRVDDETFHLGGESTLLSLRNGGGKSVLVQMMIAPFVSKRYRDSRDRPFWSYFTTNKPTFILVEWKLDGNSGYVLTGMMIRKSQDIRDEIGQNELDIFQFIHEYKEINDFDINNIPFINELVDNKKLKTYSNCKEILENLKLDKNYKFFLFDMNNSNSARNYFNKLEEYQIYRKEWESIVKKINLKESGLSDLFLKAKDETGLIEEWFLPAVEEKLNQGKNRIDEFRNILSSFIKQYKDNKSKIEQKHTILLFKEETIVVLEAAENLKNILDEKSNLENKIANLMVNLTGIKNHIENHKTNLIEEELGFNELIIHIQYEELSFEIYELEDEKINYQNELSKVHQAIAKSEEKINTFSRQRDIQNCAKIYNLYKDASMEVQELENKLEVKKELDNDRNPEIQSLGYTLKIYYDNEKTILGASIQSLEEEIQRNKIKKFDITLKIQKLENEEKEKIRNVSRLETKIQGYSEGERNFNNLYNENLTRNMLEEYEEKSLDLRAVNTNDIVQKIGIDIARLKSTIQDNKQQLQIYKRQIQEKGNDFSTISQEIKEIEGKIIDYNREIENRKTIIRYIAYPEDKFFNTEEILNLFNRKMEEIQIDLRSNEREVEKLEEEYNKLKSGGVLELPKEFKESLDALGLHYVYGMDWLKKNHKTTEENRILVKNNPFIPYGLIMTEKDIENLNSNDLGIYTSFPIPIIKRNFLERDFKDKESSIHLNDKVNFYLLFNDNLLDEEQLQIMLDKKETEINHIKTFINSRKEEYNHYEERFNTIKFQTITENSYKDIQSKLDTKNQLKLDYENILNNIRREEHNLIIISEQNSVELNIKENEIKDLKRKLQDLIKLNEDYKKYKEQRLEKGIAENRLCELEDEIRLTKDKNMTLEEEDRSYHDSRRNQLVNLKSMEYKYEEYSLYSKMDLITKDIEDVEARYKAITSKIVSDLKDLEDSLKVAKTRFKKQEEDLVNTSKKLKLEEDEYINHLYDSFVLDTIEKDIEVNRRELNNFKDSREGFNTRIAVLESKISQGFKNLNDNFGKVELLSRHQIVLKEFKIRIMEKRNQLRKVKESLNEINDKLTNYNSNISILSEFSELKVIAHIEFEVDISLLDRVGLDKFRGEILRDYRQISITQNDLNLKLSKSLDYITRNKAFNEEFFNKPLSTLFRLINNPVEFIEQLMTTIKAYDDLMDKLAVDIAIIEKEKERVIEILLEYVKDIHRNMEKIDKNSTIKIKDKPIKMLRIILPEWADEEYSYRTKLNDMVENLTQSGIIRLEDNENIDELIGPSITTKNLYNTVVGIKNVYIKLYKIEAERQYSISWADVAKNSGGEGFLSAFVVLSSLLSFMRRDETDIFAELEEGKVLLMDNPFAQTNSSHLLRPLMDIAKKSNTQLICLTGLGGESIYNCFDNIYVLNLIASNLRKGTQYLTSEHTKGEEFEVMLSSQVKIEDMEQIGFLF